MTASKRPSFGGRVLREISQFCRFLTTFFLVLSLVSVVAHLFIAWIGPRSNLERTSVVKTRAAIAELCSAVRIYKEDKATVPPTLEALVAEKIMNRIKTDGWGVPLHYDPATGEVWSEGGADGSRISSLDL